MVWVQGLVCANGSCGRTLHRRRACLRGSGGLAAGSCVVGLRWVCILLQVRSAGDVVPANGRQGVRHGANVVHGLWCNLGQCRSAFLHCGNGVCRVIADAVCKWPVWVPKPKWVYLGEVLQGILGATIGCRCLVYANLGNQPSGVSKGYTWCLLVGVMLSHWLSEVSWQCDTPRHDWGSPNWGRWCGCNQLVPVRQLLLAHQPTCGELMGTLWDLSHVCYPKCHSFHVIMSCLIVSVYNVHSGFRLRSIVTAHMNVLPEKAWHTASQRPQVWQNSKGTRIESTDIRQLKALQSSRKVFWVRCVECIPQRLPSSAVMAGWCKQRPAIWLAQKRMFAGAWYQNAPTERSRLCIPSGIVIKHEWVLIQNMIRHIIYHVCLTWIIEKNMPKALSWRKPSFNGFFRDRILPWQPWVLPNKCQVKLVNRRQAHDSFQPVVYDFVRLYWRADMTCSESSWHSSKDTPRRKSLSDAIFPAPLLKQVFQADASNTAGISSRNGCLEGHFSDDRIGI